MTDAELRDAAVIHLKKTTVGYVNKRWTVPPAGSEWQQALDLLTQIGASPPPPPPPPPPGTVYAADFETNDFSQVESNQAPTRVLTTNVAPLQGTYSAKVTCGPEDANQLYLGSPPRCEMEISHLSLDASKPFFNVAPVGASMQGKETWLTFSALLKGPSYQNQDGSFGWDFGTSMSWCIPSQIESSTGSAWPVYAINIIGPAPGTMYLIVRGPSFQGYPNDPARSVVLYSATPLDTLLKFKIHHKWSVNTDGLTECYVNNVFRGAISGANMWADGQGAVSPVGPGRNWSNEFYLKGGIYRTANGITHDSTIWLDNYSWYATDPGSL